MLAPGPFEFIDLFAGCGGMTRGFQDAGLTPIFAVDFEPDAAATYCVNFPTARVFVGDIADVRADDVPKVRVVVGGPPCQGFSGLGKRDPDDRRNRLWRQYKTLVHLANPDVFVIENVARFLKAPEYEELAAEFRFGSLSDYEFVAGVLHAEDYGVPQRRHRAFLIASRIGTPSLPRPTHDRVGGLGLAQWATVRKAFDGLPPEPAGTELPHRQNDTCGGRVLGPFDEADIHVGRTYQDSSIERYDHILVLDLDLDWRIHVSAIDQVAQGYGTPRSAAPMKLPALP
jgi:DNA (cytosine-5)-methyltransferase 1